MLEAAVIGLACDGEEMLIAFLLHLQAFVYGGKLVPSARVQVLLLMGEQL